MGTFRIPLMGLMGLALQSRRSLVAAFLTQHANILLRSQYADIRTCNVRNDLAGPSFPPSL